VMQYRHSRSKTTHIAEICHGIFICTQRPILAALGWDCTARRWDIAAPPGIRLR
jgi:hypothetical protein